jgi:hydroxyacylglutathione hydrolase
LNKKKRIWLAVGIVVVLLAIFIGPIALSFPIPQAERIDGGNLVGVDTGGSFAWVIPSQSGVILIDAGWDVDAVALNEEIAGRPVMGILITHGHFDHIGALSQYPDAPVYIGPGEDSLLKGEVAPGGWMARMSTSMMAPPPYSPQSLITISDGSVLEIDGESFYTLHTPGHTAGSAMYIWQDVLFTGDSIVGRGNHVNEIPTGTADDFDAIRGSVSKVLAYSFERLADGHVGLHNNARSQVEAYLAD